MVEAALETGAKNRPSATPPSGTEAGKPLASGGKRAKSRGVFVRSGRVYDSENGKTCHQCRQKTRDFSATCKSENDHRGKPCRTHFCRACLLNRYGESAEEAVATDGWCCPKCRGICNCSFCMKKRGQQPTGILAPLARSTGFSSVSQMLQQEGLVGWELNKAVLAGSSPEQPIDVDEELDLERRREVERDREIQKLKTEIAALEKEIGDLEKSRE